MEECQEIDCFFVIFSGDLIPMFAVKAKIIEKKLCPKKLAAENLHNGLCSPGFSSLSSSTTFVAKRTKKKGIVQTENSRLKRA